MARDPARIDLFDQPLGEMQPRRRRRNRTVLGRKHRLIARPVRLPRRPLQRDVRRQRHVTHGLDRTIERIAGQIECEFHFARIEPRRHCCVERSHQTRRVRMPKSDAIPGLQALCRPCERAPPRPIHPFDQVERDLRLDAVAHPHTIERRRDHARIVEDERIAGLQKIRQIEHTAITQPAGLRIDHEHASRIPRVRRIERDPLLRQFEIEQVGTHGGCLAKSKVEGRGAA